MKTLPRLRRPLIVLLTLSLVVFSGIGIAFAAAQSHPTPHTRDFSVGQAKATTHNAQTTASANQLALDPPVPVPATKPTVVTIINQQPFANANGVQQTVSLPAGQWAAVIMRVDGQQTGRQYDRLMQVYDGTVPLFVGVTPEPTAAGITWNLTKDISNYLPILNGQRVFTVNIDNYPNSVDNGIPIVSVSLSFYSGPTPKSVPASIVPVNANNATSLETVNAGQSLTVSQTFPNDVTSATLHIYAIPQIGEEFWWAMEPSFRQIDVSIDGKPAGAVWPFPYIYTGGVNPLLWRPITGIHTLDIPAYQVDLTPFAGLLGGQHTITLSVENNTGYWLMDGDLSLTENSGHATTGHILTDTLSFPTSAPTTTDNVFGSTANQVTGQTAALNYEIKGQFSSGSDTWTDDLTASLQFSSDQTNITDNYLQFVHNQQTATTTEVLQSSSSAPTTLKDTEVYTLGAPNAFLQSGSNFFLPTEVGQSLDLTTSVQVGSGPANATHLYENVQGYGALEEDSGAPTITKGATTGEVLYQNQRGQQYQRLVVARNGAIQSDLETNSLTWQP